ncbi:DNA-binding protein Ets97D-like [Contarinia nasturtii]|uniref:DNA-binding protein Ets97D-like n=1 Tax=Contarinia nasturtii TaxID=265458 RepID=UPI0012D3A676|nr:DNA-binding protein Ets97D-like [Contarinia nasturtii]
MDSNFPDNTKMETTDEWGMHNGNAHVDGELMHVYMDIKSPIVALKVILEGKTEKPIINYEIWLQNVEKIEPSTTLVDQCENGEGLVQVIVEILHDIKRINIADVVKPTEEVVNAAADSDIAMDDNEANSSHSSAGIDQLNSFGDATRKEPVILKRKHMELDEESVLPSGQGNRTGNNGQIQLWQFLLDILTDKRHQSIIQWIEGSPQFHFIDPEEVAKLWGQRKNKPAMNYDKLSRALRYYYGGSMLEKVAGKRYTYQFVYPLKELMGKNAQELADFAKGVPRQPKPRRITTTSPCHLAQDKAAFIKTPVFDSKPN